MLPVLRLKKLDQTGCTKSSAPANFIYRSFVWYLFSYHINDVLENYDTLFIWSPWNMTFRICDHKTNVYILPQRNLYRI